jgi:hypothetical protein
LSLFLVLFFTLALAQTPDQAKNATFAFHHNELTLAGLRPGLDNLQKVKRLYAGHWLSVPTEEPNALSIIGNCTGALLQIEANKSGIIQQIILTERDTEKTILRSGLPPCADMKANRLAWLTGRNVALGSKTTKLHAAYGDPSTKSPSSKGGQQLELWYYAFDWAGADVPQVMEVLCTKEKDGKPGQVIEITLAAPSL